MITNGILLNEELIDFLLTYKKFKVLSISIDNKKNTIRKMLTFVKKWMKIKVKKMMTQKRKEN